MSETPLSVSTLVYQMKMSVEKSFSHLWIEGEITNFLRHRSGHCYFTIKDEQAQLRCAFFKFKAQFCFLPLADGMKVRVKGSAAVYVERGELQFVVDSIKEAGKGDLHQRFEALKEKLREEGLFESHFKKALSKYPASIGIITSPTGAVIEDMVQTLKRRAPWVRLYLYPVRVQGAGAAEEIARALELWNQKGSGLPPVDLLIVGRGGGSLEDLWAFNEECVARAIFQSDLPVISAVGHETDFSIADFVADVRAATPTAAAELSAPEGESLRGYLAYLEERLKTDLGRAYREGSLRVSFLEKGVFSLSTERLLAPYIQLLEDKSERFDVLVQGSLEKSARQHKELAWRLKGLDPSQIFARQGEKLAEAESLFKRLSLSLCAQLSEKLQQKEQLLQALGPQSALSRGYALVRDKKGKIIRNAHQVQVGDHLRVTLGEGELAVSIDKAEDSAL